MQALSLMCKCATSLHPVYGTKHVVVNREGVSLGYHIAVYCTYSHMQLMGQQHQQRLAVERPHDREGEIKL